MFFEWLVLWVLWQLNIAKNHHIIHKIWWASRDIEPTCQFEGFHKQFEEIWHDFGPLWVCAACQTQCATPWVCAAPVENLHCGVALCGPCPSVYAPRPGNFFQLTSNTHFVLSMLCNVSLCTWFTQWLWFWSKLVYKGFEVMGLIFSSSKTHFANVMFWHIFTDLKQH